MFFLTWTTFLFLTSSRLFLQIWWFFLLIETFFFSLFDVDITYADVKSDVIIKIYIWWKFIKSDHIKQNRKVWCFFFGIHYITRWPISYETKFLRVLLKFLIHKECYFQASQVCHIIIFLYHWFCLNLFIFLNPIIHIK
jgi:hypothetical protein